LGLRLKRRKLSQVKNLEPKDPLQLTVSGKLKRDAESPVLGLDYPFATPDPLTGWSRPF
jgi:hypothetical protein